MTKMVIKKAPDSTLHSRHLIELQYTIAALQNSIISILENQQDLSKKLHELEVIIKGNRVQLLHV